MSEWASVGVGWVVMVGAQWSVAGRCVWQFQRIAAPPKKVNSKRYCWLKKSCTSWYVVYPTILGFIHPRWCRISSINSISRFLVSNIALFYIQLIIHIDELRMQSCIFSGTVICWTAFFAVIGFFIGGSNGFLGSLYITVYPVSIRWVLSNIEYRKCSNFANYY